MKKENNTETNKSKNEKTKNSKDSETIAQSLTNTTSMKSFTYTTFL